MNTLMIEAKVLGRLRPVFSGWRVDLPESSDGSLRLRDLITAEVIAKVILLAKDQ